MSFETLLFFIPACLALNMAPGPNNLLSVANGTRYGFSVSCLAGVGRLVAFVGMITISATGLAVLLQASEILFLSIKIAGAIYLFYLALQLWRAPVNEVQQETKKQENQSIFTLARQEFWVAAGNAKAILIFTAFFPQFINATEPAAPQFFVLGCLFLVFEWLAIAVYGYLGSHLHHWFSSPKSRLSFNRSCGALLGVAGIGLLADTKS